MKEDALLLLYGLCAWGSALNFPAWARLAWRRLGETRSQPRIRDTRLHVRAGLMVLSGGVCLLASTRLFAALFASVPLTIPSPIGLVGIGLMSLAEPIFLRVDEIHAQDRGKWSLAWRLYWAGATAALVMVAFRVWRGV